MRFESFSFGSIRIDGTTYEHDILIDGGKIRKRKKKESKKFREAFGHTPVSVEEEIPWNCKRLVIGTGTGALPVMEEVKREAKRRKIVVPGILNMNGSGVPGGIRTRVIAVKGPERLVTN